MEVFIAARMAAYSLLVLALLRASALLLDSLVPGGNLEVQPIKPHLLLLLGAILLLQLLIDLRHLALDRP